MGINYAIDAEARIVRLSYVREPTVDELAATMRAIFRSVDYRPGFGFLVDRRTVGPPTREFIDGLLAFMTLQRAALAGGRWAIVVTAAVRHGMGGMGPEIVEGWRGPMPIRPFVEIADAESWLRETAPEK
jgi:hypothetical protein